MLTNVAPIKSAFSLPNNDPAYVLPVDGTIGESFQDNQVLRGAQTNLRLRFDFNHDRPMDCRLLERERAQRYIDAHAGRMAKEKHTILQRETSRVWTPAFVALQKAVSKVRSISIVILDSPQCCTAKPPITQKGQRRREQKSSNSTAMRASSFKPSSVWQTTSAA